MNLEARPQSNVLTVSQLTQSIKNSLEGAFPDLCLQGEVSNFRKQSSGHLYFSLKDNQAQISTVMFRGNASKLKALPKDGDQVMVKGSINVYAPRGNYQLVIRELSLVGVGALLMKLEELKIKLHKKGYFAKEHKKTLPLFPKRIGVVSSPTGAALQDMLNVLSRRHSGFNLLLNPVKVQGEGAAEEIATAIKEFNALNNVDVIIIGRGGGSIEDLWAFNEEIVAEAIYHSHIPIIGAVGHETDHCIAEYVADLRAPTPSAAAEIVTAGWAQQEQKLNILKQRLAQILHHQISFHRERLERFLRHPLFQEATALFGMRMQRLDEIRTLLDNQALRSLQQSRLQLQAFQRQAAALNPASHIAHRKLQLGQIQNTLDHKIQTEVSRAKERLNYLIQNLKAIDPKNLLKRGYTILFAEKTKSAITSIDQLDPEDVVSIVFSDGQATAQIKGTKKNERVSDTEKSEARL
jgi:exodeoxyribonuclease VII large subunit